RVIRGFIYFHVVMLLLSFVIDYRTAVLLGTAAVFPGTAAIFAVSLILAKRGDRAAKILLLAWSVLLVGTTVYAMVSFGVLPKLFVTEFGMQIGSALEMILLSFALAFRFADLRNENVRIVQSARDELEQRVGERTRELSTTLDELAHANERLRESSLRDGLTGVYNRRYFEANFAPMLEECRKAGKPFGVLVVDIDHFKHITTHSFKSRNMAVSVSTVRAVPIQPTFSARSNQNPIAGHSPPLHRLNRIPGSSRPIEFLCGRGWSGHLRCIENELVNRWNA
ncbi:MAG: 7TM diverse intracellular signaling domain-containing protein, partial [Dokdonella sp.]